MVVETHIVVRPTIHRFTHTSVVTFGETTHADLISRLEDAQDIHYDRNSMEVPKAEEQSSLDLPSFH